MSAGAAGCPGCGAPLSEAARFCGSCGRITAGHREALGSRLRRRVAEGGRAGTSIAVVFAGVLLTLVVASFVAGDEEWAPAAILGQVGQLVVGLVACRVLGRGAWRATLPFSSAPRFFLWATLGGLATFGLAHLYVELLVRLLEPQGEWEPRIEPLALTVIAVLILAPLVEEWLCRGVLWRAVNSIASPFTTLLLTAALFALLHGLEAWVFSLPHRFALGLVAGWLRWRSGSLAPAIWAHFVHNAAALTAAEVIQGG